MIRSDTDLVLDSLTTAVKRLSTCVKSADIQYSKKHVLQRMRDRGIDVFPLLEALNLLTTKYLVEFTRYIDMDEDVRPFRIETKLNGVILVFSRQDDDWRLNTILDSTIHSKHAKTYQDSTFYARIDMRN